MHYEILLIFFGALLAQFLLLLAFRGLTYHFSMLAALTTALSIAVIFSADTLGLGKSSSFLLAALLHYISINSVTFLVYHMDKAAAVADKWRVPERVLHLYALFGGFIGAFFAQRHFRHKNRKTGFQVTFWLIVVIQVILLGLVVRALTR